VSINYTTCVESWSLGFPYLLGPAPALSTPALWCHIFKSRIFLSRILSVPPYTSCFGNTAIYGFSNSFNWHSYCCF